MADVATNDFDAFRGAHDEDLENIMGRQDVRHMALANQMNWLTAWLLAAFGVVGDVAVKTLSANSPAIAAALVGVLNKFLTSTAHQPPRA